MNGIELKKLIEGMSEEQLKNMFIHGVWDVEDVDARIEVLKDDYNTDKLTVDDKRRILEDALAETTDTDTKLDVTEAIDYLIMDMCEAREAR